MKKIILGCPYGGHLHLKKSILERCESKDVIIDANQVSEIDFDFIKINNTGEKHEIKSFTAAYIRYPYDLIPPHTSTYNKREKTEYFKSLALLFDPVSINAFSEGSKTRNRFYSLKTAKEVGFKVPYSVAFKKSSTSYKKSADKFITKSLGNCFYDESVNKNDTKCKYLSYEKDDDDSAYIYKPHVLPNEQIKEHAELFDVCFVQDYLEKDEFRVYLIDDDVFIYKREEIKNVDKSAGKLLKTSMKLPSEINNKLKELMKALKLSYVCLDVLYDKKTQDLVVIDINPFGSFPSYVEHPEVTDTFAEHLLRI